MWLKNLMYNLQIMKNSPGNCLAGKIFVHFCNIFLWLVIIWIAFMVIFCFETPKQKFYGFLCLLAFFADCIVMSSVIPVLDNPFKKKNNNNGGGGGNYLSDIEAATQEANLPGTTLGNLF